MMGEILLIIMILAAILYWWDTRQSHEIALHVCRRKCANANLQLLDATVSRQRSWLRRGPSASVQICRLYGFEYSDDQSSNFGQRQFGYIVLIGKQVVETHLPDSETGNIIH